MVARLLLAIASLHVEENEGHDVVIGYCDVSVAFYHAKMEELVYVHLARGSARAASPEHGVDWCKTHWSAMVRQPWTPCR